MNDWKLDWEGKKKMVDKKSYTLELIKKENGWSDQWKCEVLKRQFVQDSEWLEMRLGRKKSSMDKKIKEKIDGEVKWSDQGKGEVLKNKTKQNKTVLTRWWVIGSEIGKEKKKDRWIRKKWHVRIKQTEQERKWMIEKRKRKGET